MAEDVLTVQNVAQQKNSTVKKKSNKHKKWKLIHKTSQFQQHI